MNGRSYTPPGRGGWDTGRGRRLPIPALALLVMLLAGCRRDQPAEEPRDESERRGARDVDLTAFPDTPVTKVSERQWTVDLLPKWEFLDFDRARLSPSGRRLAISGNALLGDALRTVVGVVDLPPVRGFRVIATMPAIVTSEQGWFDAGLIGWADEDRIVVVAADPEDEETIEVRAVSVSERRSSLLATVPRQPSDPAGIPLYLLYQGGWLAGDGRYAIIVTQELLRLDLTTGGQPVAVAPLASDSGKFGFAVPSPDGARVVRGLVGQVAPLRLLDVLTGRTRDLDAIGGAEDVRWSPDGRYLAIAVSGEPPTPVPETGYTLPGRWSDALVIFDREGQFVARRAIAGWRVGAWAWAWDGSSIVASAARPNPDAPAYAADDLTYGDVYFFPVSGPARRLWENVEGLLVSPSQAVDGAVLLQVRRSADRWETLLLALDGSGPMDSPDDWQGARVYSLPFGAVAVTADGEVSLWTRARGAVRIARIGLVAGPATAFGGCVIFSSLRPDQTGVLEVIDVQGLAPGRRCGPAVE